MPYRLRIFVAVIVLSLITGLGNRQVLSAAEYTVSLPKIPTLAESPDKGLFVEAVKLLHQVAGTTVKILVVPGKRSVRNVLEGVADYHLPMPFPIDFEPDPTVVPYALSTATYCDVPFVLYSPKNTKVRADNLEGLRLETLSSHTHALGVPVAASDCIPCSLKKVDSGRIDGFIYVAHVADPVLRKLKLQNVRRQLYHHFKGRMVLQNSSRKAELDRFLSDAMQKLHEAGLYERAFSFCHTQYDDWQP